MTVAVVGAGLAGLACAAHLQKCGYQVTLYDQAAAPGGRLGHLLLGNCAVDAGAQFFTVRDSAFQLQVNDWLARGVVAPWQGQVVRIRDGVVEPDDRGVVRYVGMPTMDALAGDLARGLALQRALVTAVRAGPPWQVHRGSQADQHASVVLAVPPERALDLLPPGHPWAAILAGVRVAPCRALAVAFDRRVETSWDAAFVEDGGPLAWVARDSSKPGRPPGERWVLHATPDATRRALDDDALVGAFGRLVGGGVLPPCADLRGTYWPAALPLNPLAERHLWDPATRLGVAGDWCAGPRVEGAWLSGDALSRALAD